MKNKKIAFTLVELLVTVSIITIISFSSISGFFNFIQEKEANMKITEFSFYIDSLDKKIKNHDFFDYQVNLNSSLNDSYIIYYDYFNTDIYQTLTYNLSGIIGLDIFGSSDAWYLKIYKDGKLNYNSLTSSPYVSTVDSDYDYKFISYLSGSTETTDLNNIELRRFDKTEKEMTLTKIVDSEGSDTDIGDITIRNIGGKKDIYDSSNNYYDEIYLYFENKGAESYIQLTK